MGMRWRLALSAVALLGWLAYLGYAALTKSRDPIVSHAQAAAAAAAVVANVEGDASGKPATRVQVAEPVWGKGPEGTVAVPNLTEARGFTGTGDYLLLLTQAPGGTWLVVGQQRSPGSDLTGAGGLLVYRWTDDVRKQAERLRELAGKSGR